MIIKYQFIPTIKFLTDITRFRSKTRFADKQSVTLKQLTNLQIGDFVTHIDHGIGEFAGLHKIDNNGKKQESIKLIYKDGDILYISVHSL